MNWIKVSMLVGLLGLPLMGGDCGGTAVAKCAEQKTQKTCEQPKKEDGNAKCSWTQRTPSYKLSKKCMPIECMQVLGSVVNKIKPTPEQASKDEAECKQKGCYYTPYSSIFGGTWASCTPKDFIPRCLDFWNEADCTLSPGCEYINDKTIPETGTCSDATP